MTLFLIGFTYDKMYCSKNIANTYLRLSLTTEVMITKSQHHIFNDFVA